MAEVAFGELVGGDGLAFGAKAFEQGLVGQQHGVDDIAHGDVERGVSFGWEQLLGFAREGSGQHAGGFAQIVAFEHFADAGQGVFGADGFVDEDFAEGELLVGLWIGLRIEEGLGLGQQQGLGVEALGQASEGDEQNREGSRGLVGVAGGSGHEGFL